MKADKLIELTHTFPVTNKQRIFAYTTFEAITVLSCVALMTGPLTISTAIRGGRATFSEIILGIVAQAVVLYLLLYVLYLAFDRFLQIIHISRWRSFLIPCLFGTLLLYAYTNVQHESDRFLDAFYEGHTYYGYSRIFVLILDRFGHLAAVGAILLSIGIALTLILLVAPNQHSRWKYFFRVPLGDSPGLFGAHLRAVTRSSEFLLATFFVLSISVAVLWVRGYYPPYWLAVVSFQAVYAVPTTETVRKLYRFRLSPLKSYLYLFAPYILAETVIAIPVLAMSAIKGLDIVEIGKTAFICLISLIAALAISIFFPAEKYNPFSVFVGIAAALSLVLLIAFTTVIWQIPEYLLTPVWAGVGGVCLFYSLLGINATQRKEYYGDI
ncbi:MAG: hypothetical protein Q4A71_07480 [Actinomycetaceae bacterium]|nr:hypothetical protein [Actinomycetaceae bacterium]